VARVWARPLDLAGFALASTPWAGSTLARQEAVASAKIASLSPFESSRGRDPNAPTTKAGPWIALALLLLGAYLPVLSGRIIFGRDLVRYLHPMYWFVGDSLKRGDSPWWMPHIGLGHSLLADPQSAIFYPANLLHRLGPLPVMMMVVGLLHIAWGALGMVKLAQAFRIDGVPALVAGLAWALSGFVASLWTNGARLPSSAWIPWQVLAFVALARALPEGEGRALVAMAGLALASGLAILAGDPFVALMGTMVGFALALVWLADRLSSEPRPMAQKSHGLRFLVAALLASGLGALLAGASLVPAAAAVAGTERAGGIAADIAQGGSLHPLRLLEFAAPEAFARAWFESPAAPWVSRYLDGTPLSFSTYLGGSVLVLVVLAFLPVLKRQPSRRTAALVAAVAMGFLLMALGRHTPIFAVVRVLVPPLSYMRTPEKFLLAFVPCAALLTGLGARRLFEHKPRWTWALGALAVVGLPLLAAFGLPANLAGTVRAQGWHAWFAGVLVLGCWVLAQRRAALAALLLAVVVTADLATAAGMTLRWDKLSSLQQPALASVLQPNPASPTPPFPRLFRGAKVQLFASHLAELDSDLLTRETLRDNLSVPLGVAILPGYGVAIPPELGELLAQGRLDALRLLAVDYALLSAKDDTAPVPEGLALKSSPLPGVRLYEVKRRVPRSFVTFHARTQSADELGRHLLDPDVVAGRTVLLDASESWTPTLSSPEEPLPCTLQSFSNHSLVASCESPKAGLAVFVEQFAPGWHATVDGAPAPVIRANRVMRAVPMPAGRHAITLNYRAPGLATGVLCSVLALGAVFGLVLAGKLRRRNG